MNPVHVLPVEIVRHGRHRPVAVEVLSAHHSWFSLSGSLTLGDAIVGAGTLLLAVFTWKLGRATYALDERNAARERKRHERQVRGVARLVYGELGVINTTLELALRSREWRRGYPVPQGAWDRGGAIIAETLREDEAQALIDFFSEMAAWLGAMGEVFAANPGTAPMLFSDVHTNQLGELAALLSDARRYLKPHAYPDARDLEPDPDGLLAYRKERRRAQWKRPRSFKDR
jgi:hypothetical protein